MTCPECVKAEANPRLYGGYRADCQSCRARQFAHSPSAKQAMTGNPGPLQTAMEQDWPTKEAYRKGLLLVHQWIKKIDAAPLPAKQGTGN